MKRRLAGVAITMLIAALAVGCGDSGGAQDGKEAGTTPTTATGPAPAAAGGGDAKAEYIARADKICTSTFEGLNDAGAKIRARIAKTKKPPPERELVRFVTDRSLPAYDRMLARLRDLAPPKRDERVIDAYIASLAGAIDKVKAAPTAYVKQTTGDPFADANARAEKYGLKTCGS